MNQAKWFAVGAATLQLATQFGFSMELLAATFALAAALADLDPQR